MPSRMGLSHYERLKSGDEVPIVKVVGVGLRGMPQNLKVLWGIVCRRYVVKGDNLVNLRR